ncbi:MAG TPA: SMR family transporter [Microbacterium sp.]|uniref:DMT family transporter n=1 Tax=Microbacterium sp. TaxID=51671 RepID=UPI002B6BCF5C|nr:SMR family transporter [Microbacterium sp.]HWI31792.1 SMR family transporter [Microbacterium sp.]
MMWLALAGAIVAEVVATLSLRASDGLRKRIWILPLLICYPAAFILLTSSLHAGMPIGVAYGIWAASGVALTAVGARVVFKEPLTRRMIVGIIAIAVGVLFIELGTAH